MAANGRYSEARQLYESALRDGGADIALQVAYADLLLDTSRPAEALLALADQPETDAVLIRRAIAARALHDPRFDAWRRKLEGRFATAAMLGVDALHMRERALFELRVAGDPNSALRFALDNWARQKGREDALLLQQAARTAGRPDVAQVVDDWRSRFTSAGREAG
jgi:hypothetical protein